MFLHGDRLTRRIAREAGTRSLPGPGPCRRSDPFLFPCRHRIKEHYRLSSECIRKGPYSGEISARVDILGCSEQA